MNAWVGATPQANMDNIEETFENGVLEGGGVNKGGNIYLDARGGENEKVFFLLILEGEYRGSLFTEDWNSGIHYDSIFWKKFLT